MARTKTTVVTQKKVPTRLTIQTPADGSDASEARSDVRRQENDDEETKQADAENSPGNANEERSDLPHVAVEAADNDDSSSSTVIATTMTAPTPTLAQTTSTTTSRTAERSSTTASPRQVTYQPRDNDGGGGDSSGDVDSSSSSDGDEDSSSDDEGGRQRERRQPLTLPGDRDFHRDRRRTIRDLDLPTFLPTPQTSVITWIDRIDLALEGSRLSGCGDWTDNELYYILGNKLQDSAARWWVQLDRKLRDNERTWTRLKSALLRRYGERPDKAMSEWRVGQRRMMPGETYADFAAALRDLFGNNRIKERVLLAPFYRSLDRTTRLLVKQRPRPTTLEEAVDKATEINDLSTTWRRVWRMSDKHMAEEEKLACFTNSRGIYNKYIGLWEAPKGRAWNGHMWAPLARKRVASTTVPPTVRRTTAAKTDKKARVNMAVVGEDAYDKESEDDRAAGAPYTPPPAKKPKPTVRRSEAATRQAKGASTSRVTTEATSSSQRFSGAKCYACNRLGHMARESPDDEARVRNEEYLAKHVKMAVVRLAVTAHMNGELAVRDEERAERYVSTVRPAMAALRYVHKLNDNDVGDHGDDRVAGRAAPQHTTTRTTAQTNTTMSVTEHPEQVSASEEGDEVAGDDELTTGEGATTMDGTTTTEYSPTDICMELTDEKMMELGTVARVRMAVKRSKRAAKQLRAQRARERAARDAGDDDGVARFVAGLDAKRQQRRQSQGDEVRAALEEGRQQRNDDHDVSAEDRAHVILVRLNSAAVSDDDDSGGMRVEASDGLPTATMLVDEMTQHVKIDSGARYSVAGTDWMMRGERKQVDASVMYIEGIGGVLLDALGVWTFSMLNVYGQKVTVDACIIEGCTNEFLVGVDILDGHRATMDFERKVVCYDEIGHKVIIPFRTTEVRDDSMTAAVRLARSTNLHSRTVQSVEVAIAAPDGEEGIFLPTVNNGAVFLASTVTKVNNGKALIPAINTYGGRIRLPKPDTRALVLKLLRTYRDLANAKEECPPATTLNVEHRIDTGNTALIMMRRRRQAQTEDAVVDSNVDTMLSAGVIEPGEGAWGFPVVLVRKEDGSRFVHLAGYYRKFIAAFGTIVEPLTRLLKKDVPWEWSEAQEFAFERVKMLLTTRPLLLYPNFELPFRLVTDASKVGLGACLMQDHGRGWQPIAYGSKVNSTAETNYSITELECLAVVCSVKMFRPYLYGRAFTIITDHAALKWLMTRPNLAGRLHRWSLVLQEYEFQVEYRPGATNVVADALSRVPASVRTIVGRQRGRYPTVGARSTNSSMTTENGEGCDPSAAVDMVNVAETCDETDSSAMTTDSPRTVTESTTTATRQPDGATSTVARRTDASEAMSNDASSAVMTGDDDTVTAVTSDETPMMTSRRRRTKKPTKPPTRRSEHPNEHEDDDLNECGDDETDAREDVETYATDTTRTTLTTNAARPASNERSATTMMINLHDDMEDAPTDDFTLQMSDEEVVEAQKNSKFVKRLLAAGKYGSMKIAKTYGLVTIETVNGWRVVLPPTLWSAVFKEMHGSVRSGHLRGPHTYGRVAQWYWWPGLYREVRRWVCGCPECGSRKAKPREVIPPLRSLGGGAVGDRWALDVAGPFPIATGGELYVIAAVEYVTRYAVACCVTQHTAENVAKVLMEEISSTGVSTPKKIKTKSPVKTKIKVGSSGKSKSVSGLSKKPRPKSGGSRRRNASTATVLAVKGSQHLDAEECRVIESPGLGITSWMYFGVRMKPGDPTLLSRPKVSQTLSRTATISTT
ncbi:unnamed protein product [Phytophthora fragariaefolia]|uniref:Unnamed protein product n=1 Tax=Phytophthora fragariaefolia TaxID=1490495 RepID=A0A9W6X974_9STRA|nr:unnamed protein product [Phytophthora fragariaefolia]